MGKQGQFEKGLQEETAIMTYAPKEARAIWLLGIDMRDEIFKRVLSK